MEGRILGLDIGNVRTGVAVSDPFGMIATALDTVSMSDDLQADARAVKAHIDEQGAVRVVAGVPLDQNGEVGPQAEKTLAFIEALRAVTDVEIVTQDERFSTQAAHRQLMAQNMNAKKRKGVVDKVAAQQILQLYLDRETNRRKRGE